MTTTVLVNGTGTIGEPLIALLLSVKDKLGIDELIFYKHTPRLTDRPMLVNLKKKDALMCVEEKKVKQFREMDTEPDMTFLEALEKADVVADATASGVGLRNKKEFYEKAEENTMGFLAQGSEAGFGTIYASGINDVIFEKEDKPTYVQIASCNTHAAASAIKHFACKEDGSTILKHGDLTLIRRCSDVSQTKGVQAPTIAPYKDDRFGTHHAKDVWRLFNTAGHDMDLFSSAIKINSQYMHTLSAHLTLEEPTTKPEVLQKIDETDSLSITNKTAVNQVFSFGRDHGHFGRILNQSVFVESSIRTHGNNLYFWSFTPQDGNAILSSVKAIMYHLHENGEVEEYMENVKPWLFKEV